VVGIKNRRPDISVSAFRGRWAGKFCPKSDSARPKRTKRLEYLKNDKGFKLHNVKILTFLEFTFALRLQLDIVGKFLVGQHVAGQIGGDIAFGLDEANGGAGKFAYA
jgi:hypothetical protein